MPLFIPTGTRPPMQDDRLPCLRVVHVLSGDLWAGAEVMAHTLIRELAHNQNVQAAAIVLNAGELAKRLQQDGIATSVLDETRLSAFSILRKLTGLIREIRPHLVHTHRKKENVLGAIAARAAGCPSVRTVHGWAEFSPGTLGATKRFGNWIDIQAGRRLQQRVVAVSDDLRTKMVRHFGREKIVVIPNGIDVDEVRKQSRARGGFLPGVPGRRKVGIAARLVPVKRHDRFVAMASRLARPGEPDCDFYIIGDGPSAPAIEDLVRRSGAADRIHLLGHRPDALSLIRQLDVLVICSEHEGVPMNVLEAIALGVPVISTPLPSLSHILDVPRRGRIVGRTDPADLAAAVADTLRSETDDAPLPDDWPYSSRHMGQRYRDLYDQTGNAIHRV